MKTNEQKGTWKKQRPSKEKKNFKIQHNQYPHSVQRSYYQIHEIQTPTFKMVYSKRKKMKILKS